MPRFSRGPCVGVGQQLVTDCESRHQIAVARKVLAPRARHEAIVQHRLTVADHSELAVRAANAVRPLACRGWRIDSSAHEVSADEIVALALAVEAASRRVPVAVPVGWL